MDLKEAGNHLYQVGVTKEELGGSHFALVHSLAGGQVPRVDAETARKTFLALHEAIDQGLVRACHDLSEGGLAVAAAEMAFAGDRGARIYLNRVPQAIEADEPASVEASRLARLMPARPPHPLATYPAAAAVLLFSESNTRFLCEVRPEDAAAFEAIVADVPHARIGEVVDSGELEIMGIPRPIAGEAVRSPAEVETPVVIRADLDRLKHAWQAPLDW
jgi:phosphoribosylformylglycinamidine synthase